MTVFFKMNWACIVAFRMIRVFYCSFGCAANEEVSLTLVINALSAEQLSIQRRLRPVVERVGWYTVRIFVIPNGYSRWVHHR